MNICVITLALLCLLQTFAHGRTKLSFVGELQAHDGVTLESALAAASKGQHPRERKKAFVCLVDGHLARLHLPHFLHSLRASDVDQHLVVLSLDKQAAKTCQAVHNAELCATEFGDPNVNGTMIPLMMDGEGKFGSWFHKGWLKTSVTLKALLLGYDVMFMDIDMVVFKNPLDAIQELTDVAVTVDCQEDYHPRNARDNGGPNLGITFFRSKPAVTELVEQWLEMRGEGVWDQNMFKEALEESVEAHPELQVQMLTKDQFPVLCCGYCNNFVKPLIQRSYGWRDHCPVEQRDQWIAFHAACMNHYQAEEGVTYDEGIIKQNVMTMIWDLKETDRRERLQTSRL